jgi:phosphopantothenoylcysteine decarboxylase/phosphopantothenate--cysteine ligase
MGRKTVLLGITGGIASYKIADLSSLLSKQGFDTHVCMTKNATEFISPLTFETLTGNRVLVDTFERDFQWDVNHIGIAQKADIILIAPATANIIAKLANGIADDMLTTTVLASKAKKLIAPSMNTAMLENELTLKNIKKLEKLGFEVIEPESGVLACKDVGKGRLPKVEVLYQAVLDALEIKKDLIGKRFLVTAGPTIEHIDPVRFLTNHSSGKMGYALAEAAWQRGAEVTLITGKTKIATPFGVKVINITSANDMFEAVKETYNDADYIIKAAAVGDYKPVQVSKEKIKKSNDNMIIEFEKNVDILKFLGENKTHQKLCGFSMETQNLIENSRKKLIEKNVDMIVANDLTEQGAGFEVDTNKVTLLTKDETISLEIMSKIDVANKIIDKLVEIK